jgi:hypothetical protein
MEGGMVHGSLPNNTPSANDHLHVQERPCKSCMQQQHVAVLERPLPELAGQCVAAQVMHACGKLPAKTTNDKRSTGRFFYTYASSAATYQNSTAAYC